MKRISAVLILFFFLVANNGFAGDFAFCAGIADGDTLFVKINNRKETIRLIRIDTPEVDGKSVKAEYLGSNVSEYTKKLVKRKKISLEYDKEKRGKYNRLLAYVYLPDGRMLNELLIKDGYAKVYKYFDYKMKKEFLRMEKAAKTKCIGLWSRSCNNQSK